ncbi:hypothetical protein [Burkholderia vietnamiensis]|uniref:hypothetical protein n=1 Tax=Burkholderia vietnamiensis TaxID=60552 RepID=UPI001D1343F3|nr:hypothetical protein [Burkholderia vietnamiensis]UEC01953.1 hypothetical protein LK462_07995 [Burkholderia vietnamiensis]
MTTTTSITTTTSQPARFLAPQAHPSSSHGQHPYAVPKEDPIGSTLVAVPDESSDAEPFYFSSLLEFRSKAQAGVDYWFEIVGGRPEDESVFMAAGISAQTLDVWFRDLSDRALSREQKAQFVGLRRLGVALWPAFLAVDYRRVKLFTGTLAEFGAQVFERTYRDQVPEEIRACFDATAIGQTLVERGEVFAFRFYGQDYVLLDADRHPRHDD